MRSQPEAKSSDAPPLPSAPLHLFVGTSGWAYPSWKPAFYPTGTPAKRLLEAYSRRLNSVEVNYTFRALPTAAMLAGWLALTPAHFRFSFKAPQRITHFARLRNAGGVLQQFVRALDPMRDAGRLGLVLFQLPPNFGADLTLLRTFLAEPTLRDPDAPRLSFEFRHASWFAEPVYALLREHNAALCIAEGDDLLTPEVHTASTHASFRLRRSGGYASDELCGIAKRLLPLTTGDPPREVFTYLKHEDEPTGALNAAALLALVNAPSDLRGATA